MRLFRRKDINTYLETVRADKGSILLDVRTAEEYRSGHIPGSINIDVDSITEIRKRVPDKNTHIYTYCQGGMRSNRAVKALKAMGYTEAVNIGGISAYKGKTVS